MISAVFKISSLSGSGFDKVNALFIFDASIFQLEIPTKAILNLFSSYSNWECIAFNGLFGLRSAKPNSSKNTIAMNFSL